MHPIKAVNIVKWTELKPKILEHVKPTEEEELKVQAAAERLQKDINGLLEAEGIEAEAELHGSVAHGTWVRGGEDLDLFIVLSPKYSRGDLHRVLDALKRHLDGDYVEALARVLAGRDATYRHADAADFGSELDLERRINEAAVS